MQINPQLTTFAKRCPILTLFMVLSTVISLLTGFGYFFDVLLWFHFDWTRIANGQWWRLITPIFLHFPMLGIIFAHLAFNLIWFYYFGTRIEQTDGSRYFLGFILLAALVSNSCQAYFSPGLFGGLSGVVFAQLGYLFLRPKLSFYPASIPDNIAFFLIGFMLLSAIGLFGGGIANAAHLAGFAFGLAWAWVRHLQRQYQ